jgi:predicted nuclease of restriction endonuclease-like (RecB) superfamily
VLSCVALMPRVRPARPTTARKRVQRPELSAGSKANPRSRGRTRTEASFPLPPTLAAMPAGYAATLAEIKTRIQDAQSRTALAVNRELITLYWDVGRAIVERQTQAGWGEAVVERLTHDLRQAFPGLAGFSPRNVWRMRAFFIAWSGPAKHLPRPVAEIGLRGATKKLPQAVAELPWGHNIALLEKLDGVEDRLWYAHRTREHGWSRATLQAQIARRAHARQGKATTNFVQTLPKPQSELAQQVLKDPYTFDFLTIGREAHERVTERDLVAHVREFLLELGVGFAFIGSQVKLTVGETD